MIVVGVVALTAATFGTASGLAVAGFATAGAAYGGVSSYQNGGNIADGIMQGGLCGN